MAGHKYGKLFPAILRNPDFQQLNPGAQNLYKSMLALPVSAAGVLDLNIGLWATFSIHTAADDVEAQAAELEASRFIVVDRDTFETLIRTYIKHDVAEFSPSWKNHKGSIDACLAVRSPKIRLSLASELERLLPIIDSRVTDHTKKVIETLSSNTPSIPLPSGTEGGSYSTQLNYNSTVATRGLGDTDG